MPVGHFTGRVGVADMNGEPAVTLGEYRFSRMTEPPIAEEADSRRSTDCPEPDPLDRDEPEEGTGSGWVGRWILWCSTLFSLAGLVGSLGLAVGSELTPQTTLL